ncbi:YugN-like family protein [Niallia oryzisoli]|uniref:YugN-like family protein n=1 Tax=Niallia oryzisoli TaxID=1737571 RepID=A0ABZ2C9T7_9BACI
MIELPTRLEGKVFDMYELELTLKPYGFSVGGNWDYEHGYFDCKVREEDGYQFLRLPFEAIDGQLDARGCRVKVGRPFLLSHKYQIGLDDHANSGNGSAAFNQFSEPADKDAEFSDPPINLGMTMIQKIETSLLDK